MFLLTFGYEVGNSYSRPYNTRLRVLHVNVYCRGDPRGISSN